VRWRIEQAEEFREEVERFTDAERVILADACEAPLRYGPVPHPSSRRAATSTEPPIFSPSDPDRRFREGKALVTSSMPELE
jgi:hypothetical protein